MTTTPSRRPAAGGGWIRHAGQDVQHRVQIGAEIQAEVLVVVARVDDHAQVGAAQPIESVGELGATDLPRECDDGTHRG